MSEITGHERDEPPGGEAEKRFREMADASPFMICCSAPDRAASFFNKNWLTFTGRTMDQELGHGWAEGLHPCDRDHTLAALTASFDARQHCYLEYRLRRADGEYRSIVCSGIPRFAPDGTFAGYIATCNDQTDAKRAEEQVIAHQRLRSVSMLAKSIAHDFNNLLGGIFSSTEIALAAHAKGLPIEEELQRIRAAAHHGAEIVRELTIYAEDETASFEPVVLASLVEEMLPLLTISLPQNVALKIDFAKNLPSIEGNPRHLRQLVMNLVTNASEAIGEQDGVICISARLAEMGSDQDARELPSGDQVQLEISDTGPGMTAEMQAEIFDPFFTTKLASRGLGLAVAAKIVRDHKAVMKVESTPGAGSRFQICFPAITRFDSSAIPVATEKPSKTGTVLLVEDDELLRLAVSKGLRRRGFAVLEARDGTVGLDLIRADANIDVILLDLVLIGMPSPHFLEQALRIRPELKVILSSAYSKDTALSHFGHLAPETFIRKPFHLADLVSTIQNILS